MAKKQAKKKREHRVEKLTNLTKNLIDIGYDQVCRSTFAILGTYLWLFTFIKPMYIDSMI